MNQQKFSLAISGDGRLILRFSQAVGARYPGVRIYDRNEEASGPPSTAPIPSHPKVADVEAIFILSGPKETATIRSGKGHRYFNYLSDRKMARQANLDLLLKQMVQAVHDLL